MYHWIAAVAPERSRGFLSFQTGFFTVFGWIFTTASTNLIYAQNFMALIALYHADMTIETWQTFLVYQILNLITAAIVIWGNKIIPTLNKFSLFYLQIGWFVVMITVVACAPTHQNSDFVFRTWINNTGWENQVICFITGLVNPLYSLGGLDGVTHLTEEMPNPSRNAPLAIAITLGIAFVTGITYLIALMFSVQDYAALSSTNTGLPLAELFRQVTRNAGGAFGLTFILFIALGPCVISSQLSTGRMFWAFSRDGALPFSNTWSKVNHRLQMPMNSQFAVTAIVAALGCLYLGSSTAFNSLLGSAVTINNCAYLVPILTNLLTGRRNMYKGVFHMSGYKGFVVNIVTVCWLTFAIIFFSFPYYKPVTGKWIIACRKARYADMNHSCKHELYMLSCRGPHSLPTVVVHQGQGSLQRAYSKSKRRIISADIGRKAQICTRKMDPRKSRIHRLWMDTIIPLEIIVYVDGYCMTCHSLHTGRGGREGASAGPS